MCFNVLELSDVIDTIGLLNPLLAVIPILDSSRNIVAEAYAILVDPSTRLLAIRPTRRKGTSEVIVGEVGVKTWKAALLAMTERYRTASHNQDRAYPLKNKHWSGD